ncbi:hypothetical protein HZB60_04290 [candidate division KSB1 bacterium]|nr:hypothetical protein [candidate division KSB1 bacterium]
MLIRSRSISARRLRLGLLLLLLSIAHAALAQGRAQEYLRQESGRYRIVYCPEDAEVVASLLSSLSQSVPVVHQQLGLTLADTVTFVITPSKAEWARVTAGAPLWANGIAYPDREVAVLKSPRFGLPYGPLPQTAVHEYVHLLLEVGAPHADFPRWFDEGVAQLVAGQVSYMDVATLSRAVSARRVHRLSQLEGLMAMNDYEARQGYAESLVAVQLLQQRFGWSGIGNLIHAVRQGAAFEEAMPRVLLTRLSTFEQDYAKTLATTYGGGWFTDTELWVSGAFVLLILVGGYAAWRRRKRTLERWREEDRREPRDGEPGDPPYVINYELIRERKHDANNPDPSDKQP